MKTRVQRMARALAGAAALFVAGCEDDDSPTGPSPVPPVAGVVTVRGTERIAWSQVGDPTTLRFRAYVDDRPVALDSATCNRATPEAACSSPLPPLTNGVHTIVVTSIAMPSGVESPQVDRLTVQKVAPTATTSAASLPDAMLRPGSVRLESLVAMDGLAFAVDVVARGLVAPVQLAWLLDGRLLIAEANGRVRVVRPGEPESGELALDAHALLQPAPASAIGVAPHPDFLRNRFVYVSFLARERADRTLLRIIRLREVGDRLGEASTLFEAPVTLAGARGDTDTAGARPEGPSLAFGPDGLLYVALPLGAEFDNEPAASRPLPSMLRLTDAGRVPDVGPLSGVGTHPLGFTWHPSTGALWAAFPGEDGEAVLRRLTAGRVASAAEAESGLRMAAGDAGVPGVLMLRRGATGARALARAVVTAPTDESAGAIRLTVPVLPEGPLAGLRDRVGDIVRGAGGTLFLATNNAGRSADPNAATEDVIVRLTPRAQPGRVEITP